MLEVVPAVYAGVLHETGPFHGSVPPAHWSVDEFGCVDARGQVTAVPLDPATGCSCRIDVLDAAGWLVPVNWAATEPPEGDGPLHVEGSLYLDPMLDAGTGHGEAVALCRRRFRVAAVRRYRRTAYRPTGPRPPPAVPRPGRGVGGRGVRRRPRRRSGRTARRRRSRAATRAERVVSADACTHAGWTTRTQARVREVTTVQLQPQHLRAGRLPVVGIGEALEVAPVLYLSERRGPAVPPAHRLGGRALRDRRRLRRDR